MARGVIVSDCKPIQLSASSWSRCMSRVFLTIVCWSIWGAMLGEGVRKLADVGASIGTEILSGLVCLNVLCLTRE